MATRGMYTVGGKLLYNHWDNYPMGTANHLLEVIKVHHSLDLFSIIRGMPGICETESIYDGRAEFHYQIDNDYIRCYKIPFEKDVIILLSEGPAAQWINEQFTGNFEDDDNQEDYTVIESSKGHYYTVTQMRERAQKAWDDGLRHLKSGGIGNSSSSFSDAFRLLKSAGLKDQEKYDKWINELAPLFAEKYEHATADMFIKYADGVQDEEVIKA